MSQAVFRGRFRAASAVLMLPWLALACSNVEVSRCYRSGALATAAPLATAVGQTVLKQGGNAFDAAVAVGFTLAVVHPQAGNIGGGGFALVRVGETGAVRALDFRETAPEQAFETMYLDESGAVVPGLSTRGALACGVPGTVAGLYELWSEYGTVGWDSLVGIAAQLAKRGFVVDRYLANSLAEHRHALTEFEPTARVFFPQGRDPHVGDTLMQKDLAATLYAIATGGPNAFYRGPVAQKIVACMVRHGGLITMSDLESYRAIWRVPVHFTLDSFDVYSMPPPSSGGIALGQILRLLQPLDLSGLTPQSPEYIHLFCEAGRLAFADRSEHLGDPDFWEIPGGLLDSSYLAGRWSLVHPDHATPSDSISAGLPFTAESEQTTHYSVCDDEGNMVALTYTLNTAYGSKLLVDGAGFLLNNEMDDFSIMPGHPNTYGLLGGDANRIEPRKRMLSSMSPTLVLKRGRTLKVRASTSGLYTEADIDGLPFLALGVNGGPRIITVVAQTVLSLTRFDLSLTEALRQPRFHHQWQPDRIYLEHDGFDPAVIQELKRLGHSCEEIEPFGDVQVVLVGAGGIMTPATDPRRGGLAGGCDRAAD